MGFFVRLDEAVLARVERASHRIQLRTGMTCFWQARTCHVLTVVLLALVGLVSPAPFWPFAAGLGSFGWMYGTLVWEQYTKLEAYYAGEPDVAHEVTLEWRAVHGHNRLTVMALIVAAVGFGAWNWRFPERSAIGFGVALCFWLMALYLQCCIPMPPGAVREHHAARERAEAEAAAHAVGSLSPV